MARKKDLSVLTLDNYSTESESQKVEESEVATAETEEPEEPEKRAINPNSLKALEEAREKRQEWKKKRPPAEYMQINVAGYSDYLYRMAKINTMTVSKYVLSLIQKDFEDKRHQELYNSLKNNNKFDYVRRESPNKGRGRNQLKND